MERLLELDGQFSAFCQGRVKLEAPAALREYAAFCHMYKDHPLTAVGLYAKAFRAEPKLLEDLNWENRFHATAAAALTLAGKGADIPPLSPEECWWLSGQARSWLRGDLARCTRLAE